MCWLIYATFYADISTDISLPTEVCMQCTRNTERHPLEDVRVCFVRGNPCFRWDFPISPETTPSMCFVQDATGFSSQKAHAKRTSMAPISVQHFHICTWWRIQWVVQMLLHTFFECNTWTLPNDLTHTLSHYFVSGYDTSETLTNLRPSSVRL